MEFFSASWLGKKIRRDEVKERYTVAAFRKEMKGIYSSCIAADTLDEAPFAYRSIEDIREKYGIRRKLRRY